jgi:hypothetical protein
MQQIRCIEEAFEGSWAFLFFARIYSSVPILFIIYVWWLFFFAFNIVISKTMNSHHAKFVCFFFLPQLEIVLCLRPDRQVEVLHKKVFGGMLTTATKLYRIESFKRLFYISLSAYMQKNSLYFLCFTFYEFWYPYVLTTVVSVNVMGSGTKPLLLRFLTQCFAHADIKPSL